MALSVFGCSLVGVAGGAVRGGRGRGGVEQGRRLALWDAIERTVRVRVVQVLVGLSAAVGTWFPTFALSKLNEGLEAAAAIDSPDAQGYGVWQSTAYKTAPPVYYDVYGFNLTNPGGVLEGELPNLVQLPRARWLLQEDRLDPEYNEDHSLVTYNMYRCVRGAARRGPRGTRVPARSPREVW
jgi:hypothetical protein